MRASSVFATQQHSSSNPVPSVQVQAAQMQLRQNGECPRALHIAGAF